MSLQLPAQTLQLAASQDSLAVLTPEAVFVLDQLVLLLLQGSHLFLGVTVLLQLSQRQRQFMTLQESCVIMFLSDSLLIKHINLGGKCSPVRHTSYTGQPVFPLECSKYSKSP